MLLIFILACFIFINLSSSHELVAGKENRSGSISPEFKAFLDTHINDDSIPLGFRQICMAITNDNLGRVQSILDMAQYWQSQPDEILIVPEDIATTKLLLVSHLEGRLDICKIILGCPKFTVPISMPINCRELELIVAFRDVGNEDSISEFLKQHQAPHDVLDKCIGLAQYYQDTLYLQIIFKSRHDLLFANLESLIADATKDGYRHLASFLSEFYRYLLCHLFCRDCIGCPDISSLLWKLDRAISRNIS